MKRRRGVFQTTMPQRIMYGLHSANLVFDGSPLRFGHG